MKTTLYKGTPKCNALGCNRKSELIIIQKNLLSKGDFATRLCNSCFDNNLGIPKGYDYLEIYHVIRWNNLKKGNYGWIRNT